MSIETLHNSFEIDELFEKITNTTILNQELKKSEKCRIIRNYFFDTEYKPLYPCSYKSIIYTDSPMLCLRMKQLEQKEQIELWKSDEYVADEKIDGIRCYLAYNIEYNKNNGFEVFSRENDESTLLPKNITSNLNTSIKRPDPFYKSFLLDCELVVNENLETHIKAFDCLFYNDTNITEEPWHFRRFITEKIVESIKSSDISTTRYVKCKKIDFYNFIKSIGGEGVVIKNFNSKYSTKGTRSKYSWIKVKGNVFDYSVIEDTLEGYVSEQSVKNDTVELSAFINNNDVSRRIAMIPLNMFNYIKQNNMFKSQLDLGAVVEFSSSFYSYKDNLFVNTFPIKIRMDKSIRDCFYSSKDIERWSA